jgi:toxin CcdB
MARFHIYRLSNGGGFAIDLQAGLFENLRTRVVAPLFRTSEFQLMMGRLSPQFEIEGISYLVAIQMISAISVSEIGDMVLDASDRADELTAAIDFIFQGF